MRKELLALGAAFIVFVTTASSVLAVNIAACPYVISSPGTYTLTADLTTSSQPYCIFINQTDNVILDLNGHSITDLTSSTVGIEVLGAYGYSNNLEIMNGLVSDYQYGLDFGFYNGVNIHDMTFFRNGQGMRISFATTIWPGAGNEDYVQYNNFSNNQIGLYGQGLWNMNISNNVFEGNVLKDMEIHSMDRSTVTSNVFGRVNLTDCCYPDTFYVFGVPFGGLTCISPCQGTVSGAGIALYCRDCTDDVFIQNVVYGQLDCSFSAYGAGYADNDKFYYNQFLAPYGFGTNGLYLLVDVTNAYGCGNRGTIIDSGTGNVFETSCPPDIGGLSCTAGYRCRDDYTLEWIGTDCHAISATNCGHIIGSVLPTCVTNDTSAYCVDTMGRPLPTTTLPYGTPLIPLEPVSAIDAATWRAAGYGWILPFFSAFFMATMFLIAVTAIAGYVGGPYAAAITAIIMTFAYSLMGIYSPFVAVIMVLLAIGSAAYLLARVAGGPGVSK
jgi:hypothetical protein